MFLIHCGYLVEREKRKEGRMEEKGKLEADWWEWSSSAPSSDNSRKQHQSFTWTFTWEHVASLEQHWDSEMLLTLRGRCCVWRRRAGNRLFFVKTLQHMLWPESSICSGLIKWSVILMVFTHFIFVICSVLILNCYACSNTLSVARNFAGWDKYMCVVVVFVCVWERG